MEFEYLHFPADAVHVDAREFANLPPSAQRVFHVVRDDGPVTHRDLRGRTKMPPRTIRYAIKRLREAGFIDTRCSLRDCRTCYFFVHKRCVGLEALQAARRKAERDVRVGGRLVEQV